MTWARVGTESVDRGRLGWKIATLAGVAWIATACVDGALAPDPVVVAPPAFSVLAAEGGQLRDHLVVLRREGAPSRGLIRRIEAMGGTVAQRHDEIGVLAVSGLNDLDASDLGEFAEVDGVGRDLDLQWIPPLEELQLVQMDAGAETDQSDAFFFDAFQWNMRQIQADDAWLVTPQGAGALVCVMDSGLDPSHQDLAGKVNMAVSRSFFPGEPDILDRNFHGTFVSGIVSTNGLGVASVAPDADLCMIKIAGAQGSAPFASIINGFIWAGLIGADAVNISFGLLIPVELLKDPIVVAMQRAVSFAQKKDVLVVASAGNDGVKIDFGSPYAHIPSQLGGVIGVGATAPVNQQDFDRLASYTNYGRAGAQVMAPGGDFVPGSVIADLIMSLCSSVAFPAPFPNGCGGGAVYVFAAGTSFAAPHVTGTSAVVESAAKLEQGSSYLRQCIFQGADKLDGRILSPVYGYGRLNVLGSVAPGPCGGVAPPPDDGGDEQIVEEGATD